MLDAGREVVVRGVDEDEEVVVLGVRETEVEGRTDVEGRAVIVEPEPGVAVMFPFTLAGQRFAVPVTLVGGRRVLPGRVVPVAVSLSELFMDPGRVAPVALPGRVFPAVEFPGRVPGLEPGRLLLAMFPLPEGRPVLPGRPVFVILLPGRLMFPGFPAVVVWR